MKILPTVNDVVKEGLIVLGGAILAAVVIGQLPTLRDWIKSQWADTPKMP
jgi:hypothetical protein